MWWPQFLISFGFVFFVEDGFRPNWWTEPRIRLKCGKRQVQLLPEYFTKLKELTSKNLNFHQAPGFCGILCFLNAPKSWLMEGRKTISCMCFFFIVFFCFLPFRRESQPRVSRGCFLGLSQISHPTSSWERCRIWDGRRWENTRGFPPVGFHHHVQVVEIKVPSLQQFSNPWKTGGLNLSKLLHLHWSLAFKKHCQESQDALAFNGVLTSLQLHVWNPSCCLNSGTLWLERDAWHSMSIPALKFCMRSNHVCVWTWWILKHGACSLAAKRELFK